MTVNCNICMHAFKHTTSVQQGNWEMTTGMLQVLTKIYGCVENHGLMDDIW